MNPFKFLSTSKDGKKRHFPHRWEYFKEWFKDPDPQRGRYVRNRYRYCKRCDRWQIENLDSDGITWYEDCEKPNTTLTRYRR